jgi:hypothetical protein
MVFTCCVTSRNGEDLSIFCTDEKRRYTEAIHFEKKRARIVDEPSSPMQFEVSDGEGEKNAEFSEETVTSITRASEVTLEWSDAEINAGGRVLSAIVRPYPIATPGTPIKLEFNMDEVYMVFTFEHGPTTRTRQPVEKMIGDEDWKNGAPESDLGEWCEFFLPRMHFGGYEDVQCCVVGSGGCEGEWRVDMAAQRGWFRCGCYNGGGVGGEGKGGGSVSPSVRHCVVVRRRREGDMKVWAEGVVNGWWGCCSVM